MTEEVHRINKSFRLYFGETFLCQSVNVCWIGSPSWGDWIIPVLTDTLGWCHPPHLLVLRRLGRLRLEFAMWSRDASRMNGALGHSRPSERILFHFCHTTPPTASTRVNTFSSIMQLDDQCLLLFVISEVFQT